jgi:PIN domain nuclease of toxin-antitoxin system
VTATLADRANEVVVSAASALEIAAKVGIGKLDAAHLLPSLSDRIERIGATVLPISLEHAVTAGSLNWAHRDPFDRLLVAQASLADLTLVTVDRQLTVLPVPRVLTW